MARQLTLTFLFEHKPFDAEIIVEDGTENATIAVYIPDKSLHHLLPEGKATLQAAEQPVEVATEAPAEERLKAAILLAFKEHEDQSPPVNMW